MKKKVLLAGKTADGTPALYIACRLGYHEIVKTFIQTVFAIDCLSLDEKKELLAGKKVNGTPALNVACYEGYHEIVKILVETMCHRDLTWDMTIPEELITGKGEYTPYTPPALFLALQHGHSETVKVLLNTVLSSPLGSTAKQRLLTAKPKRGMPALSMAIIKGKMDAINVFVEIVKTSDAFTANEKDILLKPYNDRAIIKSGVLTFK